MSLAPPAHPTKEDPEAEVEQQCLPAHAYHCFDALFCALTAHEPLAPQFPAESKWCVRALLLRRFTFPPTSPPLPPLSLSFVLRLLRLALSSWGGGHA